MKRASKCSHGIIDGQACFEAPCYVLVGSGVVPTARKSGECDCTTHLAIRDVRAELEIGTNYKLILVRSPVPTPRRKKGITP